MQTETRTAATAFVLAFFCACVPTRAGSEAAGGKCSVADCPHACGVPGSACYQPCLADGTYGACERPTGPVDTQNDTYNCGQCGNVCPTPIHAAATCVQGRCSRGACDPGFADVDGPTTFGCEAPCAGGDCGVTSGRKMSAAHEPGAAIASVK